MEPTTELDARYSVPDAEPTPWQEAVDRLETAELFWISTVRADARPHTTPLVAVWLDGALHFCTGAQEQKARNLAVHPDCLLHTGDGGPLDVVVEGRAERVTDHGRLRELADGWFAKYGEPWRWEVADGAFRDADGDHGAHVFAVRPESAYAYRSSEPNSMTRYRF